MSKDQKLKALFSRTQLQWKILGEQMPYWSVLTQDIYKPNSINANIDKFFQTGGDIAKNFIDVLGCRTLFPTIFELGAGVGRLTNAFIGMSIEKYIACDISKGNLNELKKNIKNSKKLKVLHLKELQELEKVETFELFVSFITLQHNTPPVQEYILDVLFSKLKKGGIVYFQTIFEKDGYSFDIQKHLESELYVMDMHRLSFSSLHALLNKHGLELISLAEDSHGDANNNSHTVLAVKK